VPLAVGEVQQAWSEFEVWSIRNWRSARFP
jgi:hypothetical protein